MLMSMHSGLPDYDDATYEDWTITHPSEDWSPIDIVHEFSAKPLLCAPGLCHFYSSAGYELLGLAILSALEPKSAKGWRAYDQLSLLSFSPALHNALAQGTTFPLGGPSSPNPFAPCSVTASTLNAAGAV